MSIQRWKEEAGGYTHMVEHKDGGYVTYSDHMEALRQARAEWEAGGPYFTSVVHECCEKAQVADEALRQAQIEAAKVWEQMSYDTGYAAGRRSMERYLMADDENSYAMGQRDALDLAVQRVEALRSECKWPQDIDDAIAAIKGDSDDTAT